ncbi:bifunctional hydroxymethylpyrimidine kinase/phosphomethylpyrimidine kinase [Weissella paramesenteroides]|nr:bifunctional hydroxymethylpyrimidine kinase/phosphomethylpyrimidine kinase [Weissella paramesenteroides]KAA8438832.1 bifunctional hydroxymethylpyrimidine kinase/phosphomethylpyrimidine kinase [Weissella paramesenteroides]
MAIGKMITIAGSDILAGGGIQADLATFNEYGLFGLSAITSIVTVTKTDFDIHAVPIKVLAEQLASLGQLTDVKGIKVGLLPTVAHIELVSDFLRANGQHIPVVIDPVMAFKETDTINVSELTRAIIEKLLPLATVVTPNLIEAQLLTQQTITSETELLVAAKTLHQLGAQTVVVKGGMRLPGDNATDAIVTDKTQKLVKSQKLMQPFNNGAGCTFSSAIASQLAQGETPLNAISDAKNFVHEGILQGVRLNDAFEVGNVWQAARRYKGIEK